MAWRDLSLRKKILLPVSGIGCLLALLSTLQAVSLMTLSNDYGHINEHFLPAIDKVLNADRDFYQAQVAERTIAMGQVSQDYADMHKENLDQVQSRVSATLQLPLPDDIKNSASLFLQALNEYRPKTQQLIKDMSSGSIEQNTATALSLGPLDKEFENLRNKLDVIGEQLSQQASLLQQKNNAEKNYALAMIIITVILATILVAAIAVYLPRAIATPINQLSNELADLTGGKGDLTHRMSRLGKDEIGQMSHNFNRFISGLQKLMVQIQTAGNAVGQARAGLKKDSEDCMHANEQYSQAMEEVSRSNHEMGTAIAEVAENTKQAAQETRDSITAVQKVSGQFGKTRVEIESLADNINSASSIITELAEESGNIASVVDVINDIAEQTNLLALNAAIEAARAGEQGRGFAVVADEVRTLASRTQQSTEDINKMIESLKGKANSAVTSMTGAQEKAGRTVDYSQESESQVLSITDSLDGITSRITQVASAVDQQASSINEINSNLNNTQTLSQQATDSANSIGQGVDTLNSQAEKLRALIMGFNV